MDERPKHHMGAAGALHFAYRIGLYGAVLAGPQLPHRLLRLLFEQRHCCEHLHQVIRRCLLPVVHTCHVSQSRCAMGDQSAGIPVYCVLARTHSVLCLRRKDPGEEQVGTNGTLDWQA